MSGAVIEVRVPGRLEFLGLLRDGASTLGESLRGRGVLLPPDAPRSWGLAVYEAATNVVRHGYGGGSDEPITLEIRVEGARVLFRMVDRGAPHEAWAGPPPGPPEPGSDGGYGMFIITRIMDDVTYRRDPLGHNELCLIACLHESLASS